LIPGWEAVTGQRSNQLNQSPSQPTRNDFKWPPKGLAPCSALHSSPKAAVTSPLWLSALVYALQIHHLPRATIALDSKGDTALPVDHRSALKTKPYKLLKDLASLLTRFLNT
jgi:hypothetical protein